MLAYAVLKEVIENAMVIIHGRRQMDECQYLRAKATIKSLVPRKRQSAFIIWLFGECCVIFTTAEAFLYKDLGYK